MRASVTPSASRPDLAWSSEPAVPPRKDASPVASKDGDSPPAYTAVNRFDPSIVRARPSSAENSMPHRKSLVMLFRITDATLWCVSDRTKSKSPNWRPVSPEPPPDEPRMSLFRSPARGHSTALLARVVSALRGRPPSDAVSSTPRLESTQNVFANRFKYAANGCGPRAEEVELECSWPG